MSRLENILPVAIQCNSLTTNADGTFTGYTVDNKNFTLTSFEKLLFESCRGTYSFKEIAVMMYSKTTDFQFTLFYETIKKMADKSLFKNKEDVQTALKSQNSTKQTVVSSPRSKEEVVAHLRKISLFSSLPNGTLQSIAAVAEQKVYSAGDVIIKKDTIGDEVYVLLNGEVGVYASFYLAVKGEPLAKLKPVSVFGESAAISNKKRTADVVATTESLILKFNMSKVVDKSEGHDLNKNLKVRLVFQQLVRLNPLFKTLPGDVLQLILSSCTIEKRAAHETVVQQGDLGHNFYFILSGAVNVIKDHLPEVRLSVGSYFGEVGALLKQQRTATIVAETESIFLVLTEKNFIQLLASNLFLALAIEKEINERGTSKKQEVLSDDETEEITVSIKELEIMDLVDFAVMAVGGDING